jgi:hypothetical protein
MKRTQYPQSLSMVTLLLWGLTFPACDSSGPEFVEGDTRIIEGALPIDVTSDNNFFAVTKAGTVSILVSTVEALDSETGEPVADPVLGVSIGQPNPDDETLCQLTFSKTLGEGESFSVYFRDGLYCVTTFRPPETLQEVVVTYVLTLTGAFS